MRITNSLKVLQLGKFYPIKGGVEKVMYDLMVGLSTEGMECDMLCAACHDKSFTEQLSDKAKLMVVHTVKELASTMISPSMVIKLREIAWEYDIIHVHHPDPMAALALYCSGYKGKVVLHWHSDILKQKSLLKFYLPLQKWLLKRADIIVGTSPVYVKESPFLQGVQHKVTYLPIGVSPVEDVAEKAAELKRKYQGKRIIFSLGRLVPYKGFRYLIEAAKLLGKDYVVLIGGTGPLKEELQAQIEAMRLKSRVKLLGFVRDEDLPIYYGACDLFCMSSVMKTEAFGIVQIEAMSCGKPVVATRIPQSGVAWVNAEGESGLNAEPCDAKDLARAIREVLADEETYGRFSEGALNRYRTMFTQGQMINNCLDIYTKLWK